MSEFDLVIKNHTVATASEVFLADIGVKEGRIVQIGQSLDGGKRTIDASRKYVLQAVSAAMCMSLSSRARGAS